MQILIESIKEIGITTPIIVRKTDETGAYEIISGHRRTFAAKKAGIREIPAVIYECSDELATILMVDSNIQRTRILPSEKARAYRMKYEAIKHQGTGRGRSDELIGFENGLSGKTIQRFIRLSQLDESLLRLIDNKKLSAKIGYELAVLPPDIQHMISALMKENHVVPTESSVIEMKRLAKENALDKSAIERLMLSKPVVTERKVVFGESILQRYFQKNIPEDLIKSTIIELLEKNLTSGQSVPK